MYYRLPVPIEPMKVIAVVAIAGNMSAGQIAAAGLILGILFLAFGYGRWLDLLEKYIPKSVIRGIQLVLHSCFQDLCWLHDGDLLIFGLALALMVGMYVTAVL
jgi:hypothetical protein